MPYAVLVLTGGVAVWRGIPAGTRSESRKGCVVLTLLAFEGHLCHHLLSTLYQPMLPLGERCICRYFAHRRGSCQWGFNLSEL